ncbi:hypothetical protein ACIBI3_22895 [Actinomadura luteofluorescens]|uniref:hypothetical protein n=1 Tax=Actinomadura luteofluorescens TaxID=46163 RepID=UPI00346CA0E2
MSFPIWCCLADPLGQKVPEVPQILRRVEMAAGECHAGLRREVGGPRRPLRGASLEAVRRLETVVDGLDLRGVFPLPEAIVRTTATGPDRFACAGYRNGDDDVNHWGIGGDLDRAFRTAPEVITLLVGAGTLRDRRRPVAWASDSTVPLESLASGRFLAKLNQRIGSISFGPKGARLGTWESLWLLAGSVAKLVRALPDGPAVRLLLRVPTEEHWLPLLPALHQGYASPELRTVWFERTKRDRDLLKDRFTRYLEEMLGEHRHRVQVVAYDALHDIGSRLEAAVARGRKPTAIGLLAELRETDDFWKFVLHPRIWEAVRSELDAERRFALEDLPLLDGLTGLVHAADVVDLLKYGSDGLAVVVDEANAARRMIGLAERFARRHPDGAARMVAIGPLGKILGGTPGPYGPFALFRGDADHVVVVPDPEDPTAGKQVPTGDLLRELYFVR